jgi:hypothetical protein
VQPGSNANPDRFAVKGALGSSGWLSEKPHGDFGHAALGSILINSYKPKPYKFTGFGSIHGPKPYKFTGFGSIHGPKPYKFIWFGSISYANAVELCLMKSTPPDPGRNGPKSTGHGCPDPPTSSQPFTGRSEKSKEPCIPPHTFGSQTM